MARNDQYNPSMAGAAVLRFCTEARRTLHALVQKPKDGDEAAWEMYVEQKVVINRMDHNELRAALRTVRA